MTSQNINTRLKRLERAYKHKSVSAFGSLLVQANAECSEVERKRVEEWFYAVIFQTDVLAQYLERVPFARLLVRLLYGRNTFRSELLRRWLLKPLSTEVTIEYVEDEDGRVTVMTEAVQSRWKGRQRIQ